MRGDEIGAPRLCTVLGLTPDVRLDLDGHEYDVVGQPIGHRIDHMLSGTRASIAINIFIFGPKWFVALWSA